MSRIWIYTAKSGTRTKEANCHATGKMAARSPAGGESGRKGRARGATSPSRHHAPGGLRRWLALLLILLRGHPLLLPRLLCPVLLRRTGLAPVVIDGGPATSLDVDVAHGANDFLKI